MKFNNIQCCYSGEEISPEQFIPEHIFLVVLKGAITAYDGKRHYQLGKGDYCIARKNHLIRYTESKEEGCFEKIVITLDEVFLRKFFQRHPYKIDVVDTNDAFLLVKEDKIIAGFIGSLEPYYNNTEQIDEAFVDIKREELLLILLKNNPKLAHVFFNFRIPEKIDMEEFMNRNFRFNATLERFAFLTGRSLSTFRRDFLKTFHSTPGNWLTKKRLEEAYFLIKIKGRKPSEIYLDLGFEDLSHFTFAFRKEFEKAPGQIRKKQKVPLKN